MVGLLIVVTMQAQRSASTTTFLPNETIKTLTLTAADSVTQGGTSYWKFAINKPKLQYFAFVVEVDTMGSVNNHIYVDVKGSLDGSTWVATGATQVKYGATVDSTFSLVDVSTGVLWKYLKLQFVSQDANVKGSLVKAVTLKVADK